MKNNSYENELSIYRDDIDLIDKELVSLLEKRMEKVSSIGLLKKKHKIEILDKSREEHIINSRVSMLKNKSYDKAIKDIFVTIMKVCKDIQL